MAEATVVEEGPGSYRVTVVDGSRSTVHAVVVPSGLPEALGCPQVPGIDLVRWSFTFLLAREAPTSILRRFSLEQIGDYFPEYGDAVRQALGG
jgi:hypothetical protein